MDLKKPKQNKTPVAFPLICPNKVSAPGSPELHQCVLYGLLHKSVISFKQGANVCLVFLAQHLKLFYGTYPFLSVVVSQILSAAQRSQS